MQSLKYFRSQQAYSTIFGNKILGSSKVNGILVPATSLQSCLHRFVSNLVIWTDDPNYKIQLPGSSTGISYYAYKYIVCTMHQIKDISFKKAGILLPDNSTYLSSSGFSYLSNSDQANSDDNYDLIAFDFTDQATKIAGLSGRFFQLNSGDTLEEKEEIVAYLAYGYPSADQRYEVDDKKHVGLVSRSMTCHPVETPFAYSLGACRLASPEKFDMDGLSGGPVFASVASGSNIVVKLAGIINRAGNGMIHFIRAKAVQNLLDRALKS